MFRLSRYFSIANLLGLIVVAALLSAHYRSVATKSLILQGERTNLALALSFANALFPVHSAFIRNADRIALADLPTRPEIGRLRADAARLSRDLPVVKIKIYSLSGMTIFSTDPRQIGEIKKDNAGYRAALSGSNLSELAYRNEFLAFERVITDRNLLTSYIPIRHPDNRQVEGVLELYSDVTELVAELDKTVRNLFVGVVLSLSTLYVFLYLIVHRADRIMQRQERERLAQEAEMRRQAYHDSLTGLANRAGFVLHLDEVLTRAKHTHSPVGLMFLDLDHFKEINDRFGHQVGDALLRSVAARISSCTRERDVAFRMGGDEFTITLEHIRDADEAIIVARRIIDTTAKPFQIDGHELRVTVSVGIAIAKGGETEADTLLKQADTAMYRAKDQGRNQYAFFQAEIGSGAAANAPA